MSFTECNQNNETENVTKSAPKQGVNLVAVGVRAAFCTIIAIVLLCGCILSFSPYTAMRFYSAIGNREMALSSAEKYLNRNDGTESPSPWGKYADALYYAANTSAYFLNKCYADGLTDGYDVVHFAEKTDKYASKYLQFNSLGERTEAIDRYNITHAIPVARPKVYSYLNYLKTVRFKAHYVMYRNLLNGGNAEDARSFRLKMLDTVQDTITGWGESESNFSVTDSNADSAFLMFSQLTEYINGELYSLGLKSAMNAAPNGVLQLKSNTDNGIIGSVKNSFELFLQEDGTFTREYTSVTLRFSEFVGYLRDNCIKYTSGSVEPNAATQQLKFASYLCSLADFTVAMQNMTSVLAANTNHYDPECEVQLKQSNEEWLNNLFVTNVRISGSNNQSGFIYEWYERGMLADYLLYLGK